MTLTSVWRHLVRGVRRLARPAEADQDIADELQHFLDQATEGHVARGLTRDAARRAAQLEVGNLTGVRERVRASLWENAVTTLATDLRYSVRMLRHSPVFTVIVVLVISLGVGAVTTIFSAANALLLTPLHGTSDPARLVGIDRIESRGNGGMQASYPYYTVIRDRTRTLSGVAVWAKTNLTIAADGAGHTVYGNVVSGNYFSVLGVHPALGRFFLPEEDSVPLKYPVVVVSHDFWRVSLGGDSSAIGRMVRVNGTMFTLIGVTPKGFNGVFKPIVTSAWVPLMMQRIVRPPGSILDSSSVSWLWMFGRMKDDASADGVRQDLVAITAERIAEGVEPEWMRHNDGIRLIGLTGLPDDARKVMLEFMGVLFVVAALVLLIAGVNVAAMLSARAVARRHEMAIRVALGAARSRLVGQLLTETLVLFLLGALSGLGLAFVATRMLEHIPLPGGEPLVLELSPDIRVLGFALFVALFTGAVFGLSPALQAARYDINSRLRADSRSGSGRQRIVSNALVVGQLALSLVLLVSAGLLLRALQRGQRVDPQFDMSGVTTSALKSASWGYDDTKSRAFSRTLRERIAALPGVTHVSYANALPLQWDNSNRYIRLDDAPVSARKNDGTTRIRSGIVDVDYFDVLKIPVMAGRVFAKSDDENAPRVAVVNETLARKHWPNGSAVGHTFEFDGKAMTIVGVAHDSKYATLTEETPELAYFAIAQEWPEEQTLMVRTTGAAQPLASAIQSIVRSIDPGLPRPTVVSLKEATSSILLPQRVAAFATGTLGALGLLLATVGLYGIISYSVSRRSREIGVRMALGARASDVQRMVVAGGMRLAGVGVVIGLLLAVGASRLLVAYLYGVSPLDAPTFAATCVLFISVAFLASYLPARRAAAADPLVALRAD
ncbi:MAG: ABC transporter permease [bacterium]